MAFKQKTILALATLAFLGGCSSLTTESGTAKPADPGVFFEDFNYSDMAALAQGGWIVRTKPGLPGAPDGLWGPNTVTLENDPDQPGNRMVQLIAKTDGSPEGTARAQLCHARKYFEGTYATRMRFANAPTQGPDGDAIVQSFYLVSPLRFAFDPQYSELDWEYLANGGWGDPKTRLYSTSWQTVQLDPWNAFNQHHEEFRALEGWHILMMQVAGGKANYFLDGVPFDQHGGRNYPVVPMSINFNIWFPVGGFLPNEKTPRSYHEDIDWVFHAKNKVLSPAEVDAAVKTFRKAGGAQVDSVPPMSPPLASSCDF